MFQARLRKATYRPSAETAGQVLSPCASCPCQLTLTRSVILVALSRTKTSVALLVSSATRLVASLANAITRPLAETETAQASRSAWTPVVLRLASDGSPANCARAWDAFTNSAASTAAPARKVTRCPAIPVAHRVVVMVALSVRSRGFTTAASQRLEERDQRFPILFADRKEAVARPARLAVVQPDRG